MDIKILVQGPLDTNSYIVSQNNECILIDPQGKASDFTEYLSNLSLKPLAILLTHGHFDHIGAVNELKETLSIPIYASIKEKELLKEPRLNLSAMVNPIISIEVDYLIQNTETLHIGTFDIRTIPTPGHTSGSLCYILEDSIFSGDTLFKNSFGRYDFPTGNFNALKESLQTLSKLEGNYTVYPGHGESTTLDYERKFNPLIK